MTLSNKVHGAGASECQATSVNTFGLHPRLIFDLDVLLTLDLNGRGSIQRFVLSPKCLDQTPPDLFNPHLTNKNLKEQLQCINRGTVSCSGSDCFCSKCGSSIALFSAQWDLTDAVRGTQHCGSMQQVSEPCEGQSLLARTVLHTFCTCIYKYIYIYMPIIYIYIYIIYFICVDV